MYRGRKTIWFCLLVFAAGCGDPVASEVAAKNDANIKRVANLYGAYQVAHGWQGPADEKSFLEFARKLPDQNLQMMKIDRDAVDQVLKSERDGKPFKIRFSVGGGPGAASALVFEDIGVGGKRQVAFNGAVVEEVDEPRYRELWEGRSSMPSPAATRVPTAGASQGPTAKSPQK